MSPRRLFLFEVLIDTQLARKSPQLMTRDVSLLCPQIFVSALSLSLVSCESHASVLWAELKSQFETLGVMLKFCEFLALYVNFKAWRPPIFSCKKLLIMYIHSRPPHLGASPSSVLRMRAVLCHVTHWHCTLSQSFWIIVYLKRNNIIYSYDVRIKVK